MGTHGRGAETFRDDPLGNSVINDVNTKTGLVIDMVKLRTQSFPVRIAVGPTQRRNQVPYNTTCRVPECTRDESLSHVLQECPAVHGLRVKRHEVVRDLVSSLGGPDCYPDWEGLGAQLNHINDEARLGVYVVDNAVIKGVITKGFSSPANLHPWQGS